MVSALEFLRHILPAEGLKCATVFSPTKKYNKHFSSCEDLAEFITTTDARGETVYHACASYKTNESRKQENVLAVRAFWIDCDTQQSHPDTAVYSNATAAHAAVESFCSRLGLPDPTYVSSGYGLHAYWTLAEAVDLVSWKAVALRLKRLCAREGLDVDQVRTADASSILRTPGTHNRKKDAGRLVEAGDLQAPTTLREFIDVVSAKDVEVQQVPVAVAGRNGAGRPLFRPPASLFAAAGNIYGDEDSDANIIADQCKQLADFRRSHGCLPEPAWYAGVAVVGACKRGEILAHEWSGGHPTYSHAETQSRLERARTFGPTTCAHFENINPKGCEGCSHKGSISSPIQLGRNQQRDKQFEVGSAVTPLERVNGFPSVPESFALTHSGLFFLSENKGNQTQETISAQPIYLDSIQTGEITSDDFSLCFKLHLPREEMRDISLSTRTFFSSGGMSEMAGRGAVIHDPELFRKYTREAMDNWHRANRLQMRYDQFGWKDQEASFLYGDKLYTASGVQPIAGSDEIKLRSQYLGPNRTGSLDRWSAAANALFTRGCEPQSFALLAAFAAPLMRFHTAGEGGAIISLVSDQSGSGKTTALEAVASAWGRLKGTQLTDDDTRVAKGLTLGVLGNIPCVFDELYNRDPEEVRKFVLAFTNGRDKMRGTVDGQLRHSKAEWQTILVLASNNSIVDILGSLDGTDAPAFRVLEFITSFPDSMEKKGDELKRELAANSGFAADAYLKVLLQPETLAYVKKALPEWTDSIWKRTGLRNEHRFWVRTLASVVAAGVIVRHAGILDFSVQRILDWAVEQLASRAGDPSVTNTRRSTDVLSEFINANINAMLVMPVAWRPHNTIQPRMMPKQGLLMRYELDSGRLWILESELRKYLVKRGVNRTAFLKELRDRNVVADSSRRNTLGAGTDLASGQVTTIEVNMNHPAISGVAVAVEQIIPKGVHNTREQRVENFTAR